MSVVGAMVQATPPDVPGTSKVAKAVAVVPTCTDRLDGRMEANTLARGARRLAAARASTRPAPNVFASPRGVADCCRTDLSCDRLSEGFIWRSSAAIPAT